MKSARLPRVLRSLPSTRAIGSVIALALGCTSEPAMQAQMHLPIAGDASGAAGAAMPALDSGVSSSMAGAAGARGGMTGAMAGAAGASGFMGNAGAAGMSAGIGGAGLSDASLSDAGMNDAGMSDADVDPANAVTPMHGLIKPAPEWDCGMPGGIPAPDTGELVFELTLELDATLELGMTQFGMRRVYPSPRGTFMGAEVEGAALAGGYDWELTLPSGAREIETRHVLRTASGTLIYMRTCGVAAGQGARVVADFEVPSARDPADLGQDRLIGTRVIEAGTARFAFYRVPSPSASEAPLRTIALSAEDRALPRQGWECIGPPASAGQGDLVLRATVGIGSSLSVGQAKHGSRNIIPITGGTFTGDVSGDVIPGGADFQLTPTGGSFQLEARYTLRAQDGTLISVRNCGGVGGTAPYFETLAIGPHAFLNEQAFVGTIGISIGSVIISVFQEI
jgi:hypothetical protein